MASRAAKVTAQGGVPRFSGKVFTVPGVPESIYSDPEELLQYLKEIFVLQIFDLVQVQNIVIEVDEEDEDDG